MTPAFRYHARILKLLQFRNRNRRWVLKSPDYITMIPQILEQYPDCRLVYTHRDPVKAFGSVVSLLGTLQWQRCDSVFRYEARDSHVLNVGNVAGLLDTIVDLVANGAIPQAQLLNLQFRDIVRDPLSMASAVYAHFGIPLTPEAEAAMRRHVEATRAARRGHTHDYSVGSPEHVARARHLFRRYQDYFGVPDEV